MSEIQPLRFEVLPFPSGIDEALRAPQPLTLTVTCSPRHGMDHTVEVAERLAGAGHSVVVHVAARMVASAAHLDELLDRMRANGLPHVFLIGGDAKDVAGPYHSALDLIADVRTHRSAPRTIGIGAYPEGHPLIDDARLVEALHAKSALADYLTTQLCFDPDALTSWLRELREDGIQLPAVVGVPGAVDPRRLLEISMKVGVGASIRYARKQHGLTRLLGRRMHAAERVHRAIRPLLGDPALGIEGLHYFTFNRLLDTVAWALAQDDGRQLRPGGDSALRDRLMR